MTDATDTTLEGKRDALDAIHDVALSIMNEPGTPRRVQDGISLIVSLARYQHDVRSTDDHERFQPR